MLALLFASLASSQVTWLEIAPRVLFVLLASGQDTWPGIVERVPHLQCAILAIRPST